MFLPPSLTSDQMRGKEEEREEEYVCLGERVENLPALFEVQMRIEDIEHHVQFRKKTECYTPLVWAPLAYW